MVCKKGKEGESSPLLVVTPSRDYDGGRIGSGSLGLCLLAEMLIVPGMVWCNSIEKLIY